MKKTLLLLAVSFSASLVLAAEDIVQLTDGPGNDTEAAWSPDGKRIVFQTDRNGDLDLYLLDVGAGEVKSLVTGPGHACFPAWSPDGKWIVYSYAHFTRTGFEKDENGYNLFIIPSNGGEPRRLTQGLVRDYTPVFGSDGKTIYFSSARHPKTNAVGIFSIPVAGGEPVAIVPLTANEEAAVQPDFSADGRFLAYGYIKGFRGNWALRFVKTKNPADAYFLTNSHEAFYGPRWSPKEPVIACTGFQVGDQGWNVYLICLNPLQKIRLTNGPGNSRSPNWSPDGKELVFENNRAGAYKLYRIAVPALPSPKPAEQEQGEDRGAVLQLDFSKPPGEAVLDLSGRKNEGRIHGSASWEDGAMRFDGRPGWIVFEKASGFDFGEGTFSVKATISVLSHTNEVRIICVGDYPNSRNGWQLYIGRDNMAYFSSRTPDKIYRAAVSDLEAPVGRPVTLVGTRLKSGVVQLFVDGALQSRTATEAFISYPAPNQIRIGAQWNDESVFNGRIYDVSVYSRELTPTEIRGRSLQNFLKD